jgi:hypothetical protein
MKPVYLPKQLDGPTPPELARAWGLTLTDEDTHWVLELPDSWAVNQLGAVRDDKGELRFKLRLPLGPPTPQPPASGGRENRVHTQKQSVSWLVFPLYRLFEHKTARVDVIRGRATVKVFENAKQLRRGQTRAELRLRAETWMDRVYPEWRNPLAYWGTENKIIHGVIHQDFQRAAEGKRVSARG